MDDAYRDLIERLTCARKELGWGQDAIARRVNAGQPAVSGWEGGKRIPTLEFALRWAEALGGRLVFTCEAADPVRNRALEELARRHPGEISGLLVAEHYRARGEDPAGTGAADGSGG